MKNLKLHAEGEENYLKSLKSTYENLKQKVINNKSFTEAEKQDALKKISTDFNKDKNELNTKLF